MEDNSLLIPTCLRAACNCLYIPMEKVVLQCATKALKELSCFCQSTDNYLCSSSPSPCQSSGRLWGADTLFFATRSAWGSSGTLWAACLTIPVTHRTEAECMMPLRNTQTQDKQSGDYMHIMEAVQENTRITRWKDSRCTHITTYSKT